MSDVRGPNSALTEFLRSQGINATEIRARHQRRQGERARDTEEATQAAPSETDDNEVAAIAAAAAAKRRRDEDDLADEGTALCAVCNSRFTLTVYTRETKDGVLCRHCSAKKKSTKKKMDVAARKKRKQIAAALLDMKNDTTTSLQDICINTVADYIDAVDELGDLTSTNFAKISQILTKNRRLDPRTMQLFLRPEARELEFWDCSSLTTESLNLIPAICSNLERLTLAMCGQLSDENLLRIAQLPHLKHIYLDGPFLVRKDAWIEFFAVCGERLESLTIKSVYRVDAEVLAMLVEMCPNLQKLSLHRLSQLNDSTPFYLLANLSKLRDLALVDLESGALSDHVLTTILNSVGSQLTRLAIHDTSGSLTDGLVHAIAASCGALERLELIGLGSVTDDAIVNMFQMWEERNSNCGLTHLSLERCIGVGDAGAQAALAHSKSSLVELNLNSLKLVTGDTFNSLVLLPNLSKVDLGFVGSLEPYHVFKFASTNIKLLLVFGNIRLSGMPLPPGITVLGTM